MYRLVVAEKPSVAKLIASVLNANERRDGFFIGNGHIVTWCAGHLVELAPPDAYDKNFAKWRYSDLPIIPAVWKYIPVKGKEKQLKTVTDLMNRPDVECVINACDAGREGENIMRNIYCYAGCTKKMLRFWVSSVEESAIKAGLDNLRDGAEYDSLYKAASCRERADWIVGYAVTRLISILYGTTLTAGRVQSPTLAMLVSREADITGFVKEPFYTPAIDTGEITASGNRTKEMREAEAIRAACDGKNAAVQSVERQKKSESPPKLYDLTALQRDANRLLGFTAQQTLTYAQSLYEKAVLSYPRVDSKYLASDMRGTAAKLADWLQSISPFADGMPFTPDIDRLIDDSRVTDHHAIIPTAGIMRADLSALPSGERDIVNLVTVRLLCASAEPHTYEATTAAFDCCGHIFTAKGKTIITDGWKAIDAAYKASLKSKPEAEGDEDEPAMPELSKGRTFYSVAAMVKEGATTPPKHFTEDTLLSSMENAGNAEAFQDSERKGLGTPATRAAIIEKLVKTSLVERRNKNIMTSDKGKNLVAVLPDALTSPLLTSEWEHRLSLVQKGELSESEFMAGIAEFITAIVTQHSAPKPEFAGLFASKTDAETLGVCPRCGMPVREASKGFFCDSRTCGFKLWKDSKFWTAKKKPLTAPIVAALLKDGRVSLKGLRSERTDKEYNATVSLDYTNRQYVRFKMEFGSHRG